QEIGGTKYMVPKWVVSEFQLLRARLSLTIHPKLGIRDFLGYKRLVANQTQVDI
ncbi:MAG: hypothetical protein ACI8P5_002434, partial [Bacteroidia bacterium]